MSNHDAYIVDYCRTPFARYAGALSSVRPDDLAAHVLQTLAERHELSDKLGDKSLLSSIDDCIFGCANQAGEDNRNIARMALLLAGYPLNVPGTTINRLCGSGLDATLQAARAIKAGEAQMMLAGGVESMSRAPFVMPKASSAFNRQAEIYDSTIGWRFVNPRMKAQYGIDSMPETAENVAKDYQISRADQDAFALLSQQKAAGAQATGHFAQEISAISATHNKETGWVSEDEQPRATSLERLNQLKPLFAGGSVTAGNASSINDGAAALLLASAPACQAYGLKPLAKVLGGVCVGVEPRVMGIGPAPAVQKLCDQLNLSLADFSVIELNEAFASQSLAVLRTLGIEPDDARLNRYGGAIALGHPLGASGARLIGSAALQISGNTGCKALITMCIGVGQGIAVAIEAV